jgi:glucose-1-phosphate adenylyltransferase
MAYENHNKGIVLAGGQGNRLRPLTERRSKPAVPIGPMWRMIDPALSNYYNSAIRDVYILSQDKTLPQNEHIQNGWMPKFGINQIHLYGYHERLQLGNADGVGQYYDSIISRKTKVLNIFAGDHIFVMNISLMNDVHQDNGADLTICALPVKKELAAGRYGVLSVDESGSVIGFREKPASPDEIIGKPGYCWASMGDYAFNPAILGLFLKKDMVKLHSTDKSEILADPDKYTMHDIGNDIVTAMLREGKKILLYDFFENKVPGYPDYVHGYWRDVGEIKSFYDAHMDILDNNSPLSFYNPEWEIGTNIQSTRPVRINIGLENRVDKILAANGTVIEHADVYRSTLSYDTVVRHGAHVEDCILMGEQEIGKQCRLRNTIVDRQVRIPKGTKIGFNAQDDLERGFTVSNGITVVPRGYKFPGQEQFI